MSWSRAIIAAGFVLTLAACGFSPMYAKDKGVRADLSNIQIANIPDRAGQYLRNELMDLFYRSGKPDTPAYDLNIVNFSETLIDLDITSSSTATRRQIRLGAEMILTDRKSGAEILRRNISVINSFNVLESQFSTRISENDARQTALNDMARRIESQLALYFNRT